MKLSARAKAILGIVLTWDSAQKGSMISKPLTRRMLQLSGWNPTIEEMQAAVKSLEKAGFIVVRLGVSGDIFLGKGNRVPL